MQYRLPFALRKNQAQTGNQVQGEMQLPYKHRRPGACLGLEGWVGTTEEYLPGWLETSVTCEGHASHRTGATCPEGK